MRHSELFKEARRLHQLGLSLIWLHPKSKRPVETGWTSRPKKTWEELTIGFSAGMNLGVRTDETSKMGSRYLAVIDVDVKDPAFKEAALARLSELTGGREFPEVRSGSGNGSRHLYCTVERPFKMITVEKHKGQWEICIYSRGRQMVLPPSIHPDTGKTYAWARALESAEDLPELDVQESESSGDLIQGDDEDAGDIGNAKGSVREANRAERSDATLEFEVEPVDLGWLPISKEVKLGIVEGEGVVDRSGFLLKASSALISAGLTQNEVLTVLTDPETFLGRTGYDHAKTKSRARAAQWIFEYTFKKIAAERSAKNVFSPVSGSAPKRKLTAEEMAADAEEFAEGRDWRQDLDKNQYGAAKVTLKNLDLIFSNAVGGAVFIEDLFANRIEYGTDTPWGGKAKAYIKDIDMILVKRWLADTEFRIEPSKDAVLEATSLVAHRCRIHPVRDWLDGLNWDGTSRISTWIRDFCQGEAAEPYLSEVSRKFILAMVKRVFEPGCQWDYVLVLEGKQGKFKSSIARALASDKWFMDNLPDLKDKDSMLNLQGKWLIELGELADVKRADYNLVKAYLVRRTDTVRPHYGRLMSDVPRQSVFIGTINEGQYLKDPTGNRRYWPVKVGLCDVKALSAVRDQLFAEAMHVYRSTNEVLMLGAEATDQATEAQDDRRVDDEESEMREALVEFMRRNDGNFDFDEPFKARDLFVGPNAPWSRWTNERYSMNTAAGILRTLGFERKKSCGQRLWNKSEIPGHPQGTDRFCGAPVPRKKHETDFR